MSAALRLLGHNLGLGCGDVMIRTRAGGTLLDLPLQGALQRIDDFDLVAQSQLITALSFEFDFAQQRRLP